MEILRRLYELILANQGRSVIYIAGVLLILLGALGFTFDLLGGIFRALFKNPTVTAGLLLIFGRALWDQLRALWARINP